MVVIAPDPTDTGGPTFGPPPVPHLPHLANPLPILVHGAEYVWDDVWDWTKSYWHGLASVFEGGASLGFDTVTTMIDDAVSTAQTAWSSFVSTLESWITAGIDDVGSFAVDLDLKLRRFEIYIQDALDTVGTAILHTLAEDVAAIDADIANIERLLGALPIDILGTVETWVATHVADPILEELKREVAAIDKTIEGVAADIRGYAESLVNDETLRRIEALAALGVIVHAITTWIDDCGEPMCAELGPRTNLGKLLSNLELQTLFAALLALSLGDPKAVADATETIVQAFGPALQATVENWLVPLQAATPG